MNMGMNSEIYENIGDWYSQRYEVNPVGKNYHDEDLEYMNWDDFKDVLKSGCQKFEILRIRFITDSGFPLYDLSYFHVRIDGVKTEILDSPFTQISKKHFKSSLYNILKKQNVFIPNFFNHISTLA